MGGCVSKERDSNDDSLARHADQQGPQQSAPAQVASPPAQTVQKGVGSARPSTEAAEQKEFDEADMWGHVAQCGSRSQDTWGMLQRLCDHVVAVSPVTCFNIMILSTSRKSVKVLCNSQSPLMRIARREELCKAVEFPTVLQVVESGRVNIYKVHDKDMPGRRPPPDCSLLYTEAGCVSFVTIPIIVGRQGIGAVQLASRSALDPDSWPSSWIAAFFPWIGQHLAEVNAVRLVNTFEKIQSAVNLNSLAWLVTSELDSWFEWTSVEDTEARLVLLSEDRPTALVLSKSQVPVSSKAGDNYDSPAASMQDANGMVNAALSSRGSAPIPRNSSAQASTSLKPMYDGLLGTQMSLVNTLTRRCLSEGSKLLYVADVMAALKKYGEPWRDVFLEQPFVEQPRWVIAAPLMAEGKHLAAIIWISSSRVNPNALAQAAKTSVPPLLHCMGTQLHSFIQQARGPASSCVDEAISWTPLLQMRSMDSGAIHSMWSSHGCMDTLTDMDCKPIRYQVARTESAPTSALMRMYQSAIQQNQPRPQPGLWDGSASAGEEIEVIAKAGQGAFGSVYVAMWRGQVVAAKVMKQQLDGRRAMRTAWELAVTKSVRHANVVNVLAVLTDVAVEKRSRRLICFLPASYQEPSDRSLSNSPMVGGGTSYGPAEQQEPRPADDLPRCQVVIMEYCNLGPLHHYMAERKVVREVPVNTATNNVNAAAANGRTSHLLDNNNPAAAAAQRPSSLPVQQQAPGMLVTQPSSPVIGTAMQASTPFATAAHTPLSNSQGSAYPMSADSFTMGGRGSGGSSAAAAAGPQVDMGMVLPTLVEVAEAMSYLHSCNFIHCDLKPENILLKCAPGDPRGFTAKVSDFGLSELHTLDGPMMGELGGTVTHIAPEIVIERKVTMACDVYSFGIIMWELYSGQRPYMDILQSAQEKRARDRQILTKVAHEGMRPVFPAAAPHDYAFLAQRCWQADPLLRPTFNELLNELRNLMDRYLGPGARTAGVNPTTAPTPILWTPSSNNGAAAAAAAAAASAQPGMAAVAGSNATYMDAPAQYAATSVHNNMAQQQQQQQQQQLLLQQQQLLLQQQQQQLRQQQLQQLQQNRARSQQQGMAPAAAEGVNQHHHPSSSSLPSADSGVAVTAAAGLAEVGGMPAVRSQQCST